VACVYLTHWLHRSNQHVSLYFAIAFIHGKPTINWELIDFFIPHVINHYLERHIMHHYLNACGQARTMDVCVD